MNLLFLDSIERETYGGMEEWIRLVGQGLSERGHNVTIAGRNGSEFLRRISESKNDVAVLDLEISGDFNPLTIARLRSEITDRQVDVVVVNFNKDVRLGGLASCVAGNTKVVWSVGLDITKDSLVHRFLTPRLVDRVVVPSESLKNQITRLGYIAPESVEVVPIGITDWSCDQIRSNARRKLHEKYHLPSNSRVAITVGRLVNQKGHRYLVDAVPEILRQHPDICFVFAGDGPLEEELESRAKKLQVEEHIVFAGMLDNLDLLWAGADLMIHPSVEEPFGIAVLEGMRAGLPIIASRVGGIPEVTGEAEGAILVPSKNSDELTTAVCNLLTSNERMSELGAKGRQRFEESFTADKMCDRLETLFEDVVSGEAVDG